MVAHRPPGDPQASEALKLLTAVPLAHILNDDTCSLVPSTSCIGFSALEAALRAARDAELRRLEALQRRSEGID